MKKAILCLVLATTAALSPLTSIVVRADSPPVSSPAPDGGTYVVTATPAANAETLNGVIQASGASPLSKLILRVYLINVILYLRMPSAIGHPGACVLLDEMARQVISRSAYDLGLRSRAILWLVTIGLIEHAIPCN